MIDRSRGPARPARRAALVLALSGLVAAALAAGGAAAAPGAVRSAYLGSYARTAAHDVGTATAVAVATPALAHQLAGPSGVALLVSLLRSSPATSVLNHVQVLPPTGRIAPPLARLVPSEQHGPRRPAERIEVVVPVRDGRGVLAVISADAPAAPLQRSVGGEVHRIDLILAIAAATGWLSALAATVWRRRVLRGPDELLEGVHGLLEPVFHT